VVPNIKTRPCTDGNILPKQMMIYVQVLFNLCAFVRFCEEYVLLLATNYQDVTKQYGTRSSVVMLSASATMVIQYSYSMRTYNQSHLRPLLTGNHIFFFVFHDED
jgi:hypothetical protein